MSDQISKCNFKENEIQQRLKEQIIEKCYSEKLRKIALEVEFDVKGLMKAAKVLEAAGDGSECTRCGFTGHDESDPLCPAKRSQACERCGQYRHFARMCGKHKTSKRLQSETSENRDAKISKLESAIDVKAVKPSTSTARRSRTKNVMSAQKLHGNISIRPIELSPVFKQKKPTLAVTQNYFEIKQE